MKPKKSSKTKEQNTSSKKLLFFGGCQISSWRKDGRSVEGESWAYYGGQTIKIKNRHSYHEMVFKNAYLETKKAQGSKRTARHLMPSERYLFIPFLRRKIKQMCGGQTLRTVLHTMIILFQNSFCESHTWRIMSSKALRKHKALWLLPVYPIWG